VLIKSVTITLHRNLKYMQLLLLTYLHFLEFFFCFRRDSSSGYRYWCKVFYEKKKYSNS